MLSRRAAMFSAAAAVLMLATPALADDLKLPRQKVELVAPPFVHAHEQATKEGPKIMEFKLVIEETKVVIDSQGTTFQAMTFNGSMPGPLMVVHEGDYVEVTLVNPDTNQMPHNIDFHSATGALGGAELTLVNPGEQVVLRWKATRTGTFVYHCAPGGPMIPWHVVSGMNGAVMVLPRDGLNDGKGHPLKYDRAYYIGEQDMYVPRDEKGKFKSYESAGEAYNDTVDVMRKLTPTHVVFNGKVGAFRFIAPVAIEAQAPMAHGLTVVPAGPASSVMSVPETHYTRSGDVNIAYQVIGSGPRDLVFIMGWVSHLEYFWAEASFARFLLRLASFSRLILIDKRGTGLSDRVTELPTLEQRMDDVRAVMDQVGSGYAALIGVSEGGPMSALFAATYPERTRALVMIGTYAKRRWDPEYPWGPTEEAREAFFDKIRDGWGGPIGLEERAPTVAHDPAFRSWWATYLRMGASPGAALALTRMNAEIDIRDILPSIRVPTLVLHRRHDHLLHVEEGRYVASRIPGARFVELPGEDHLPFVGDQDALIDEIERFVTGVPGSGARPPLDRVLATILNVRVDGVAVTAFVDHAARECEWFRGRPLTSIEGQFVASFDGPARAIRCATALIDAGSRYAVQVRIGLHTGECTIEDGVASGPPVDLASGISYRADVGEVLVSRTVRDIVGDAGLPFDDRGVHTIPGLGEWRLFRV